MSDRQTSCGNGWCRNPLSGRYPSTSKAVNLFLALELPGVESDNRKMSLESEAVAEKELCLEEIEYHA